MLYTTRTSKERTVTTIALINDFTACWNAKDLTKFGSFFTKDAEYTDVTGQSALGIAAIVKQHEYPFNTVNKLAVLTIDNLLIRDLSSQLIIVTGQWTTTGSFTPDGKPLPDRKVIIPLICDD